MNSKILPTGCQKPFTSDGPLKYYNLPTLIFSQSITRVDIVKKGMFVTKLDIYNDKGSVIATPGDIIRWTFPRF